MKVSKELLSEVLKIKVESFKAKQIPSNAIGYYALGSSFAINIYELAHLCKEWALTNGYILSSSIYNCNGYCDIKEIIDDRIRSIPWNPKDFTTEPEAIFKACQWILDNKDKNC